MQSLFTDFEIPTEVLLELGTISVANPSFQQFLQELSDEGIVLEYPEDRDCKSQEEFETLVRTRWSAITRVWRWRNPE